MVTIQDDFTAALDLTKWIKILTGGGDISTLNSLAFATGNGNYMYRGESVVITGVTTGLPASVFHSTDHGFAIGEVFQVFIAGNGSTPSINGLQTATATTSSAYTIPIDVATGGGGGTSTWAAQTVGANQEVEAIVNIRSEGVNSFVILWSRFDRIGGPFTAIKAGYGLGLLFNADLTQNLKLYKLSPDVGGTIEELASQVVTPATIVDSADVVQYLGTGQHLRLIVVDDNESTDLNEQAGVILRGYINNSIDASPDIRFLDIGRSTTAISQPIRRLAGTYAITFGEAANSQFDTFAARDDYVLPAYGVDEAFRTLKDIRDEVIENLTLGGIVGYKDALVNRFINNAVKEVIFRLRGKALFMERMRTFNLAAGLQDRITLAYEIRSLLEIFDDQTRAAVSWRQVTSTTGGKQQIVIEPKPEGNDFILHYVRKPTQMVRDVDLCDIPREYDEVVTHGAVRKICGIEGRKELLATSTAEWTLAMDLLSSEMAEIARSKKMAMRVVTGPHRGSQYWYSGFTTYPFV